MNRFHFISGLPRAGSTLLSSILIQNPKIYAGQTSPVYYLCDHVSSYISRSEFNLSMSDERRRNLSRSIFDGYYEDILSDNEVKIIFDTNRIWSAKANFLADLFDDAKIICCVRPTSEIVQSIENIIAKNPSRSNLLFDQKSSLNIYTRAEYLMSGAGMIGMANSCLRSGFFGAWARNMILVRYESLCKEPELTMEKIYSFLGEESFDHDFNNLEYDEGLYDLGLGVPGLHTVRKRIEFRETPILLPPDLIGRLDAADFWKRQTEGTSAMII